MRITKEVREFIHRAIRKQFEERTEKAYRAREEADMNRNAKKEEMIAAFSDEVNKFAETMRAKLDKAGFNVANADASDIVGFISGDYYINITTKAYCKACEECNKLETEMEEAEEDIIVRASLGVDYDGLKELIGKL